MPYLSIRSAGSRASRGMCRGHASSGVAASSGSPFALVWSLVAQGALSEAQPRRS